MVTGASRQRVGVRPPGRQARRTYWRAVVAAQQRSGLSLAAFCRRRGLRKGTLGFWRWKFAHEAPVPSLSPRRSGPPHQPVCGGPCGLRPSIMDSASRTSLFRGSLCVHFRYGPGTR